jgi:hypothetical protein
MRRPNSAAAFRYAGEAPAAEAQKTQTHFEGAAIDHKFIEYAEGAL